VKQKNPSASLPKRDITIARTDGSGVVFLPDHSPAVDFKRAVSARSRLLADTFGHMRNASNRVLDLLRELQRFSREQSAYSDTPKEQRELEDAIAIEQAVGNGGGVLNPWRRPKIEPLSA
jgi:hypothetical protein